MMREVALWGVLRDLLPRVATYHHPTPEPRSGPLKKGVLAARNRILRRVCNA